MEPFGVVSVEVNTQATVSVKHRWIFHDVDVVVFDRPPQPFDKNIVKDQSSSVHADFDLVLEQHLDERHRRKLDALVAVENIRTSIR